MNGHDRHRLRVTASRRVARLRRQGAAALLVALVALGLLAGCGGGSTHASLRFELAPLATPTGCQPTEPLPPEVDCIRISVYEHGTHHRVALAAPAASHPAAGPDAGPLRLDVPSGRLISFDAQVDAHTHYDVAATVYNYPDVVAQGTVNDVTFGSSPVVVRLYRPGQVSCAGGRAPDDADYPAGRALHASIALPNGDVLIFGGVTGAAIPIAPAPAVATFATEVWVYRASTDRFVPVSVDNPDESDTPHGLARVFFGAALLPGPTTGPYTIRISGGYTGSSETPAVRFDTTHEATLYASNVLPATGLGHANDVNLVYDPDTESAKVVLAGTQAMLPWSAFGSVNQVAQAIDPTAVLLGTTEADHDLPAMYMSMCSTAATAGGVCCHVDMDGGRLYWLSQSGDTFSRSMDITRLMAVRMGASLTRLGSGTVLVWGGNVNECSQADVMATAGEVVSFSGGTSTDVAVAGGGTMPTPTAFHTAVPIGSSDVILAGGLQVGTRVEAPRLPIETLVASPVLSALHWSGSTLTSVPVDPGNPMNSSGYEAAIFQAGVRVLVPQSSGSFDDLALLSGGVGNTNLTKMGVSAQLGAVHIDGTTYTYESLASMGEPRFGHAVALLRDEQETDMGTASRVLITGGFDEDGSGRLYTIAGAEVVDLHTPPPAEPAGMCMPAASM